MGADPVVCVTGADGQVGRALREWLPGARFLRRGDLDITEPAAVARELAGAAVVINCAALTDVDGCERDPRTADRVNAAGAANVAAAGVRTIQLSTEYVFDGELEREYREEDEPAPRSVYGRSKLAGERAVLEAGRNLVVRTSWVFGDGRNFLRAIRAADRAGRELRVVDDQWGRPTWARDLARALAGLAATGGPAGIVHFAGAGEPCTWADLAELAVGRPVRRISSDEWGAPAPRPRRAVLALDRARSMGLPLKDWRASVASYLEAEA
ncbi:MAG TPA: NAD(P)-dependent oxidoreductase [Gaiellales bacterium]|nr:NAD(P)-dependent oxidoreductase [Gaiellales bacterium]